MIGLLCIVALLLQTTVLHAVQWHDGVISLAMIPILLAGTRSSRRELLTVAAACAFMEDVLCGTGFAWTIATVAVLLLVFRLDQVMAMDSTPALLARIASMIFLRDVLFWCIEYIGGYPGELFAHNIHMSLWNALLTTIVAAICIRPMTYAIR